MTRSEWEWFVAWALWKAGVVQRWFLQRETLLNFGPDIMKKCSKCGRSYYSSCLDCDFRNGHPTPEWNGLRRRPDVLEHCADRGEWRIREDYWRARGRL